MSCAYSSGASVPPVQPTAWERKGWTDVDDGRSRSAVRLYVAASTSLPGSTNLRSRLLRGLRGGGRESLMSQFRMRHSMAPLPANLRCRAARTHRHVPSAHPRALLAKLWRRRFAIALRVASRRPRLSACGSTSSSLRLRRSRSCGQRCGIGLGRINHGLEAVSSRRCQECTGLDTHLATSSTDECFYRA